MRAPFTFADAITKPVLLALLVPLACSSGSSGEFAPLMCKARGGGHPQR
ncbi:hypothetical protein [Streptomyces decoyicus]|nr:hypothetical protein [Streptomyces decoyicus]QZY18629.1 hypothetical protein K7C20_28050 [Streptomyces decoyicus]